MTTLSMENRRHHPMPPAVIRATRLAIVATSLVLSHPRPTSAQSASSTPAKSTAAAAAKPTAAPALRAAYDTEKSPTRPLAPADAAAQWKFPEGFQVSVFAAEPDVRQPIAMAVDDRGRLWVAENDTYAEARTGFAADLRDRILIFEDRDGDGRFDTRTVFADGLNHLTSIELGFGGVWALTSPTLVFIPDRDRDDRPDGPPEVMLDGFEWKQNHHTLPNGLRWGPDGWLYGRQGIQATSALGTPGTPAERRPRTNGGIWRYHPQRQTVEIVCHGTTNPWGFDWNAHGEAFFINTVIGHLWHVIPGAHYRRMHGNDLIPNVYEVIDQHADHVHWASGKEAWNDWRKLGTTPATSAAGGGHAHTGLLFYQGPNWPETWRGRLLTINFHGRRLNVESVERTPGGSGYTGKHLPDTGFSADPWFRGIDLIAGPDGGVYISDWSDAGECHDDDGVHRTSGRIYKVTYGRPAPLAPALRDLALLPTPELVPLLDQPNEFLARHARRRFQEIGSYPHAATSVGAAVSLDAIRTLTQRFAAAPKTAESSVPRLRLLWALNALNGTSPEFLIPLLNDPDEHIRTWAIRLLVDDTDRVAKSNPSLAALAARAATEPSPFVRLALAAALQRLPLAHRARVAEPLLRQSADAKDHNLPYLLWYGIEPIAQSEPAELARLAAACELPLTRRCAARRLAQDRNSAPQADALATLLAHAAQHPATHADILAGLRDALQGQRNLPAPRGWAGASPAFARNPEPTVQALFRALGTIFNDPAAREALRAAALNAQLPVGDRRSALRTLIENRADQLASVCATVLATPGLATTAAEGLALDPNPAQADVILQQFAKIPAAERSAVLSTLLSRPSWAARTLDAVASGRLAPGELSAFHARQIRGFKNADLDQRLARFWGATRDSSQETVTRIQHWKGRLTPESLRQANPARGRTIYANVCGSCHTLNGEGGRIGPELTGSARDNLDYLLQNILDPSASVPAEFRLVTLELKDGRSLSGFVRTRQNGTIVLQTLGEAVTIPATDVASTQESSLSLMPEGLLDPLPEADVRDLISYLMRK